MKGYAFWHTDMISRFGDDRPWTVGEERRMEWTVTQFQRGYHSAVDWLSALPDTPRHRGTVACVLEVSVPDINRYGVQVSGQCKLLAAADASRELRLFAVECALRVLNRELQEGREPHSRFWGAVEAACRFLDDSISLDALSAAESPARQLASDLGEMARDANRSWSEASQGPFWRRSKAREKRTYAQTLAIVASAASVAAYAAGEAPRQSASSTSGEARQYITKVTGRTRRLRWKAREAQEEEVSWQRERLAQLI